MNHLRFKSLTASSLLAAALVLAGCGKSPASAPLNRVIRPTTVTPQTVAVSPPVTPAVTPPQTAVSAEIPAGKLSLQLSSLQVAGVAGVGIELMGPGLSEPIGQLLGPDELKNTNTLVFEHLPTGALTARVVAFNAQEAVINELSHTVQVIADQEAKLGLELSAPAVENGASRIEFKFILPDEMASPTPVSLAEAPQAIASSTPRSTAPLSKALKLEILDKQTVRKFLLLKRVEVTLKITNENPTETLNGEVKVDFLKTKGFLNKSQEVVQTLTAPITSLAPGRSVEVTLTSTVSAQDANATVHTVLASNSASTRD